MKILLWVVIIALVGCATPYQQNGFRGGFTDTQLDKNTFKVSFEGNGYTSRDVVEKYLLLRCAEVTIQSGHDYFIIINDGSTSNSIFHTVRGGASSTTFPIRFHNADAMIKVFRGEKPENHPLAFNAAEIIQYLTK